VLLGRRDGTTTNVESANNLPSPFDSLDVLQQKFRNVNLDDTDLVSLQGNLNTYRLKYISAISHTDFPTTNFYYFRSAHIRQSSVPVHAGELHGGAA